MIRDGDFFDGNFQMKCSLRIAVTKGDENAEQAHPHPNPPLEGRESIKKRIYEHKRGFSSGK
jgi:hypothetical protein